MKLIPRLSLCWRILRAKPGGLSAHARRELPTVEDGDAMQAWMNRNIEELILVFSTHGHSGLSAAHATSLLEKLLRYEPLGPLTGKADEWARLDYDLDLVAQNKRSSRVFQRADGTAYDIEGLIFRDPDGGCYTNFDSRVDVTFPYTPKSEYIDRAPS